MHHHLVILTFWILGKPRSKVEESEWHKIVILRRICAILDQILCVILDQICRTFVLFWIKLLFNFLFLYCFCLSLLFDCSNRFVKLLLRHLLRAAVPGQCQIEHDCHIKYPALISAYQLSSYHISIEIILQDLLLLASLLHLLCLPLKPSCSHLSSKVISPLLLSKYHSSQIFVTFARLCLCFSATSKAFVRLSRILSRRVSLEIFKLVFLNF